MKYLIVEDERFADEELRRMMANLRSGYSLAEQTKTIIDTVRFLNESTVDLILMDIRLADGSCFEIFNHVTFYTPVIFTTAYVEHSIQAFKLNSVSYPLKPFPQNPYTAALIQFYH